MPAGVYFECAQRVRLTFEAHETGTRVTLVHDGWEALAERALAMRENYDKGWDIVLGRHYGQAAGARA